MTRCIATPARLHWAMLRAGWQPEKCGVWMSMGLSADDARILCRDAHASLAALFLPDPSRWQMFKAYLYGTRAGSAWRLLRHADLDSSTVESAP